MTRTVISILLPFLTPFVCYAVWAWFVQRTKEQIEEGKSLEWWQQWPWTRLICIGSGLAIVSLGVLFWTGEPLQQGRWVPPTVVDDVVVPGHYEPIPKAPSDE